MSKRDRAEYMRKYYRRNIEIRRKYHREYLATYHQRDYVRKKRQKIRKEHRNFIFGILGNKCRHCGFSDQRALQMDHIHGRNGEKRLGNIEDRHRFVRDYPKKAKETYQILCANCNVIKMEENREYFYHSLRPI